MHPLRWCSSTPAIVWASRGELGVGVIPKQDRALLIFVALVVILAVLIFTGLLDH